MDVHFGISSTLIPIWVCSILVAFHVQQVKCQPRACDVIPAPTCTCWEIYKQKSVSCNHANLQNIPELISNDHTINVESLEYSYNEIDSVHYRDLSNIHTRKLDLSHNLIKKVEDGSFSETAETLKTLDLSHNLLDDFGYAWPEFSVLETLDVSNNKIKDFPRLLSSLPVSTRHLKLHHNAIYPFDMNNQSALHRLETLTFGPVTNFAFHHLFKDPNYSLQKLHIFNSHLDMGIVSHQYFGKLKSLVDLELSRCSVTPSSAWINHVTLHPVRNSLRMLSLPHNNLTTVPSSILHLRKLFSISLNHNKIDTIYTDDFKHNTNLQYINLKHNHIQHVAEGAFSHFKRLRHVDLSHNRLQVLSEDAFTKQMLAYSNILVSYNPWNCDCRVKWMLDKVRDEGLGKPGPFSPYEIHNDLRCQAPSHFGNVLFMQITLAHDIQECDKRKRTILEVEDSQIQMY